MSDKLNAAYTATSFFFLIIYSKPDRLLCNYIISVMRGHRNYNKNARVMKKKMTKPEFSKWVPYAQELKQKAYDGKLEFEEYRKLIRK